MKNKKIDMLNGPLVGKIVIFALPLALSSILQQLFNSADLAVVGRFDSDKAMAAVGSNSSLVNLIVSLFLGLSVGANVVVARLIGQGRKDKGKRGCTYGGAFGGHKRIYHTGCRRDTCADTPLV